jgi:hypothetical protein
LVQPKKQYGSVTRVGDRRVCIGSNEDLHKAVQASGVTGSGLAIEISDGAQWDVAGVAWGGYG